MQSCFNQSCKLAIVRLEAKNMCFEISQLYLCKTRQKFPGIKELLWFLAVFVFFCFNIQFDMSELLF